MNIVLYLLFICQLIIPLLLGYIIDYGIKRIFKKIGDYINFEEQEQKQIYPILNDNMENRPEKLVPAQNNLPPGEFMNNNEFDDNNSEHLSDNGDNTNELDENNSRHSSVIGDNQSQNSSVHDDENQSQNSSVHDDDEVDPEPIIPGDSDGVNILQILINSILGCDFGDIVGRSIGGAIGSIIWRAIKEYFKNKKKN